MFKEIFLFSSIICIVLSTTQFSFTIKTSERTCLNEYFSELTSVFVEVKTENENIYLQLQSPDGKIIDEKVIFICKIVKY
jgi:hypothetical protein